MEALGMKYLKIAIAVCLMGLPLSRAHADTIIYRGSSTVGQFMYEAAEIYKAVQFDINTRSESSGGEDSIARGKADIVGVAIDVRPEILDKVIKKFLIGKDAIGILVHPTNPVTHLSLDQLAGIFSGRIMNWREVGGNDILIDVYIVNPRSASRSVFQKKVLGNKPYGGKRIKTIRPDARIMELVSNNPGAIGQLSFSFLKGAKVKLIHPDGQSPSVHNPEYPITRNLHLVTNGTPVGAAKAFIDWALSPSGQKVVKHHFIGVN